MALVPLLELLQKHGLSRKTYHNLLRKGLLPHYSKRFGEPGKRGARYLYDSEVFDAAYTKYRNRKGFCLGIDAEARREKSDLIEKMPKHVRVEFILENVAPGADESLTQYEERIKARREELLVTDDAVILAQVEALVAQGFKPRSAR